LGWVIDSYIGTALLTDIARLLITIYVGEDLMMEAKESERYIDRRRHSLLDVYWVGNYGIDHQELASYILQCQEDTEKRARFRQPRNKESLRIWSW
jgi:hypothetical protein